MSFEVASIRPAEPDTFIHPSFGLNVDDESLPPGGRFTADFPLEDYIEFAYKIMPTREQEEAIFAHRPKWITTNSFVIQAKAEGNPTKDQMRLMTISPCRPLQAGRSFRDSQRSGLRARAAQAGKNRSATSTTLGRPRLRS
jgi:hypothetical protein